MYTSTRYCFICSRTILRPPMTWDQTVTATGPTPGNLRLRRHQHHHLSPRSHSTRRVLSIVCLHLRPAPLVPDPTPQDLCQVCVVDLLRCKYACKLWCINLLKFLLSLITSFHQNQNQLFSSSMSPQKNFLRN